MKNTLSVAALIAGAVIASNGNAMKIDTTIINKTDDPLHVVVYDSYYYDCQLNGQYDTFNCGNGDGNSQAPGALNVQIIQPHASLNFKVIEVNRFFKSTTMLVGLRPNGFTENEYKFGMWEGSDRSRNPDISWHYDGQVSVRSAHLAPNESLSKHDVILATNSTDVVPTIYDNGNDLAVANIVINPVFSE